jgi:hypothetical protein
MPMIVDFQLNTSKKSTETPPIENFGRCLQQLSIGEAKQDSP